MKKLFWAILPFLILLVLSAWAGKGVFRLEFYATHDGNHHISRSFDAIQSFSEGHFPLRWAGTLNYFCGVPIFNFFYPLIYYVVILLNPIFKDVIFTLKMIDFLTFFVGTISMYLWLKEEIGDKWAALSGSILYLYAPYRFLLVFVRGSPEFMAYAVLPFVLYFYSLAFNSKNDKGFVVKLFAATVVGGLLTISHNFTVMFLLPLILLCLLIKIYQTGWRKLNTKLSILPFSKLQLIVFSFISIFGLGAFFIFPAVLEEPLTQLSIPRFTYTYHFPSLSQLIKSPWGYFYSNQGYDMDGMSFMLGYAQWLVLGLFGLFVLYTLYRIVRGKGKQLDLLGKRDPKNLWIYLFFGLTLLTIFMMLEASIPIWEAIPIIQRIQFPWRLLGIAVFTVVVFFTFWVSTLRNNKKIYWTFIIAVSAFAIYGNKSHMLPSPIFDSETPLYREYDKLHYHRHATTTFTDDVLAPSAADGSCTFSTPAAIGSAGEKIPQRQTTQGSTFGSVVLLLDKNKLAGDKIVIGQSYYPGAHTIEVNGKKVDYGDCVGRVCVDKSLFKDGANTISWRVHQTPTQMFFNIVTLVFFLTWVALVLYGLLGFRVTRSKQLLILIFILFAFFRFYNLSHRLGFGWDQERDAWTASEIIYGDIKLLGPRVLSDTGFFLPPYFNYLITPFYAFNGRSPFAGIYFLIFYNTAFFFISYFVLKKIFNAKTAFLFLAIWAANPAAVSMDTIAWNPVMVPLLFIVAIYLAHKYSLLSGLVYGLGISSHFQFVLTFPVIVANFGKNLKKYKRFIFGVFLVFIPVLIFDLKNKFLNTNLLLSFVKNSSGKLGFEFLSVWDKTVSNFTALPPSRIFSLALYFIVLYYLFAEGRKMPWRSLAYTWLVFPLAMFVYGSRPSEYYLNYLLVIFILVLARLAFRSSRNFVLAIALIVLFSIKTTEQFGEASFSLYRKDSVASFVSTITTGASPYDISYELGLEGDVGFDYLMHYHDVTPVTGAPLIQISSPASPDSTFVVNSIGIEVPQEWISANWVKKEE